MASNKARLYNDNVYVYETMFKGDKVKIEPGKFIEGDIFDLNELRGTYKQVEWIGDETNKIQDPKTFSMLRLERLNDGPVLSEVGHKCMQCKMSLPSERTLAVHLEEAHSTADKLVIDELDKDIQAKIAKDKAVKDSTKHKNA